MKDNDCTQTAVNILGIIEVKQLDREYIIQHVTGNVNCITTFPLVMIGYKEADIPHHSPALISIAPDNHNGTKLFRFSNI